MLKGQYDNIKVLSKVKAKILSNRYFLADKGGKEVYFRIRILRKFLEGL